MTITKQAKKDRTRRRKGRPAWDPNAPPLPTLPVGHAAKRYGVGRDQMKLAVEKGEVESVSINGRRRVVTSKADKLFGLTA